MDIRLIIDPDMPPDRFGIISTAGLAGDEAGEKLRLAYLSAVRVVSAAMFVAAYTGLAYQEARRRVLERAKTSTETMPRIAAALVREELQRGTDESQPDS